jgi:hypothetical protein
MKKAPPEADQPAAETGNRKKKEASSVVGDVLIDQNMGGIQFAYVLDFRSQEKNPWLSAPV